MASLILIFHQTHKIKAFFKACKRSFGVYLHCLFPVFSFVFRFFNLGLQIDSINFSLTYNDNKRTCSKHDDFFVCLNLCCLVNSVYSHFFKFVFFCVFKTLFCSLENESKGKNSLN